MLLRDLKTYLSDASPRLKKKFNNLCKFHNQRNVVVSNGAQLIAGADAEKYMFKEVEHDHLSTRQLKKLENDIYYWIGMLKKYPGSEAFQNRLESSKIQYEQQIQLLKYHINEQLLSLWRRKHRVNTQDIFFDSQVINKKIISIIKTNLQVSLEQIYSNETMLHDILIDVMCTENSDILKFIQSQLPFYRQENIYDILRALYEIKKHVLKNEKCALKLQKLIDLCEKKWIHIVVSTGTRFQQLIQIFDFYYQTKIDYSMSRVKFLDILLIFWKRNVSKLTFDARYADKIQLIVAELPDKIYEETKQFIPSEYCYLRSYEKNYSAHTFTDDDFETFWTKFANGYASSIHDLPRGMKEAVRKCMITNDFLSFDELTLCAMFSEDYFSTVPIESPFMDPNRIRFKNNDQKNIKNHRDIFRRGLWSYILDADGNKTV